MANPDRDRMPASNWFWIIILVLLFVTVIFWFVNPLGRVKGAAATAPWTEWAPAATGPAVPVNLPTTKMTNAPVHPDGNSAVASGASH